MFAVPLARQLRLALGAFAYALIPASGVVVALSLAAVAGIEVQRPVAAGIAVLSVLVVAFAGYPITGRIADSLPTEQPSESLTRRVERLAGELDGPVPAVRVVDTGAPNAAVYCRRPGTATLLVSERFAAAVHETASEERPTDDATTPDAGVDAALLAAMARANRDAPFTTAFLPIALAVETLVLLGFDLVTDWSDDGNDDRRAAFGERPGRDLSGVTKVAGTAGGALLLVCLVPFWLLLAVGDRLLVGGGRRAADRTAAETGYAEPLANHLVDAPDAAHVRDWHPAFDRLSVVELADGPIRVLRGTDRDELRIREARLRTGNL